MSTNIIQLIEFKEDTKTPNKYTFEENENIVKLSTELDFSKKYQQIKNSKNETILMTSLIQYFEIKIKGEYPNISIGMSFCKNINKTHHIGEQKNTIGYHSNDGKIYKFYKIKSYFQYPYNENDIIGCGYIYDYNQIFFTKNGKLIQKY